MIQNKVRGSLEFSSVNWPRSSSPNSQPRWWQLKYFVFLPLPGEMIQFDDHIFQLGWNHQLASVSSKPSVSGATGSELIVGLQILNIVLLTCLGSFAVVMGFRMSQEVSKWLVTPIYPYIYKCIVTQLLPIYWLPETSGSGGIGELHLVREFLCA